MYTRLEPLILECLLGIHGRRNRLDMFGGCKMASGSTGSLSRGTARREIASRFRVDRGARGDDPDNCSEQVKLSGL
jgi:hypothetical protein